MGEHKCVDCQATPERPTPVDPSGMTDNELFAHSLAFTAARPEGGYRPLRPRAVDYRSDPLRCYSHLAAARRRGEQVYSEGHLRDAHAAWRLLQ
jgi:hypothetical protein